MKSFQAIFEAGLEIPEEDKQVTSIHNSEFTEEEQAMIREFVSGFLRDVKLQNKTPTLFNSYISGFLQGIGYAGQHFRVKEDNGEDAAAKI